MVLKDIVFASRWRCSGCRQAVRITFTEIYCDDGEFVDVQHTGSECPNGHFLGTALIQSVEKDSDKDLLHALENGRYTFVRQHSPKDWSPRTKVSNGRLRTS